MTMRSWIRQLFTRPVTRTIRRAPRRIRPGLEALEDRLAPATLSDGGTSVLSIALGPNEHLAIVSNGTTYTFTSDQTFLATSSTNPATQATAFSAFGSGTLTLNAPGLAQYTDISISDSGAS